MRLFVVAILSSVALAGCARSTNSAILPAQLGTGIATPDTGYKLLYSFQGYPGGATPAGLTFFRNAFYGTTTNGGAHTFGTLFLRNTSGVKQLYSFKGGSDGASPQGTLVPLAGKLYGTTEYGGTSGDGIVFVVSATGVESVVHSFSGTNGANPILGTLLVANGELYGTTSAGGDSSCHIAHSDGCGVAYSLTSSGTEKVLHVFKGRPDGASPIGALINAGGTLYGTTAFGGRYNNGCVFKIDSAGAESVVYSFKGYPDGANPWAGLFDYNGTFYGTTAYGGSYSYSGTIFALTSSGTEHVLHSFSGYPDGSEPYGTLLAVNGVLYGTTVFGGDGGQNCTGHGILGCGIVYSITTSGTESVLYRFKGDPDGSNPWAGLTYQNGALYGTTVSGGKGGEGSIFSLQPAGSFGR
jgi:uncharacterized repeat protein (TIGR03803 family)